MASDGRVVLHADMDAFYASVEQRDRPELRGRPVIVGATSPRGVVAAASYEARRYGVRSAMPGFEARRRCPHAAFLPGDMAKYARISAQLHAVFAEFTPDIEPLAFDEAFLEVTGSLRLYGGPLALGRRLKERVREQTELVVSVGLAPNKLVAKIACSLGKPDGLEWCPPERVAALLEPLPVRRLWGVGPVLAEKLVAAGLRTLGELGRAAPERLVPLVGDRAEALIALARGEDPRPVEAAGDPRSIGEENTFEQDVSAREIVLEALRAHAHAVARRLRRSGLRGRTVTIRLKLAERTGSLPVAPHRLYPLLTRSHRLTTATADGRRLAAEVTRLWDAAAITAPVRLVGVAVSQLERADGGQLSLFGVEAEAERGERLGRVLDAIQDRYGATAIGHAGAAPPKLTPTDRPKRGG